MLAPIAVRFPNSVFVLALHLPYCPADAGMYGRYEAARLASKLVTVVFELKL